MYTKEIHAIVQVKEVIAKLDLLILFAQSAETIDLSTKIGLNAFSTLRDELSTTTENAFQSALSGNAFEPASLELQTTIGVVNTFLLAASNEAANSVFQSLTVNLTETLINANTVLINATQTPEPIPETPAPAPYNVCSFIPESPSYKILVSRCMGDIGQADRLIQFELKKDPSQSRAQATRAAIARWERDNSELSCCF